MAWTGSRVFRAFLADAVSRTAAFDLDSDAFKVALYTDAITPDANAAAADSAYDAGQWASANEVFEAGQWEQGGESLPTPSVNSGTADVVFWDATDVASGAAADLSDAHGCLVYDDALTLPVADQGVCFNYFGGGLTVVNGTFTVQWHADGIWRATLAPPA